MNKKKVFTAAMAVTLILTFTGTAVPSWAASKEDIKKEQDDIRNMSKETLSQLYKVQSSAKEVISKAVGYAVFSNFGMKILVAGSGSGKGMAIDNKTKKETFMKMVELQAGLGFGVKKFHLVWVFETEQALNTFVNSGWEIGAQATGSAKLGDTGAAYQGAVSLSPGVWLYQVSGDSLALELTAKGTKYYKDGDLN